MFGVGDGFSGGVKNEKEAPEHQKMYMSAQYLEFSVGITLYTG
jgi:hypothetical protein